MLSNYLSNSKRIGACSIVLISSFIVVVVVRESKSTDWSVTITSFECSLEFEASNAML